MIKFIENKTPYSLEYKDIYFNKNNGLDESLHVFLQGNSLPSAWEKYNKTTIIETGFGTGLNFLACWDLFEKEAQRNQKLHFISVEKHPLSPDDIKKSLDRWRDIFGKKLDLLVTKYPLRIPGFHKVILNENVELLLIFEDVHDALPKVETLADFWFLDGFSPATNPDMWDEKLYTHIARLSHSNTRLATFTAAGHVRQGLESAGFDVQKIPGYANKRDMTIGLSNNKIPRPDDVTKAQKIAVIGSGLAGCTAAHVLKNYGCNVEIYEKEEAIAAGASGNQLGLINPKLGSTGSVTQDYHASAYSMSVRYLEALGIYSRCGSVHIGQHERRDEKLTKFIEKCGWHEDHMRAISADNTTEMTGIDIAHGGVYLPDAGFVSPMELCKTYSKNIPVHYGHEISQFNQIDADIIILAGAYESKKIAPELELKPVKGQVTYIKELFPNKANVCFGGYLSPAQNGQHCLGASFHRGENNQDVSGQDDIDNIANLKSVLGYEGKIEPIDNWVGVRCNSTDRYPIIGQYKDNIYTSIAHGSHGIISSLLAAHILAYKLGSGIQPIGQNILNQISPYRFLA